MSEEKQYTYQELKDRIQQLENENGRLKSKLSSYTGCKLKSTDSIIEELTESHSFECMRLALERYDPYDERLPVQFVAELPIEDQAFRNSLVEFLAGWRDVWEKEWNEEQTKEQELPF